MDLWKNYKKVLSEVFPKFKHEYNWAKWEGKLNLEADLYSEENFIKSRVVEIWNEKSCIYNNILYPKTGKNLPCFGMDLMGFFEKKVIIVFDFQHPTENFLFSVDSLPKSKGSFRFFEPGNHFSENVFVRKCEMGDVDNYLEDFKSYLQVYKDMVKSSNPTEVDTSVYKDFDNYMLNLDPVGGYLSNNFGKEKSEKLVKEFLFPYGRN